MGYLEIIVKIIISHCVGDYLFQTDYLALNKGKNWYLLFIHCVLYCVPFYYFWGYDYRLFILFATHFIIDTLKARYNKVNLVTDQVLHYIVAFIVYFLI